MTWPKVSNGRISRAIPFIYLKKKIKKICSSVLILWLFMWPQLVEFSLMLFSWRIWGQKEITIYHPHPNPATSRLQEFASDYCRHAGNVQHPLKLSDCAIYNTNYRLQLRKFVINNRCIVRGCAREVHYRK